MGSRLLQDKIYSRVLLTSRARKTMHAPESATDMRRRLGAPLSRPSFPRSYDALENIQRPTARIMSDMNDAIMIL